MQESSWDYATYPAAAGYDFAKKQCYKVSLFSGIKRNAQEFALPWAQLSVKVSTPKLAHITTL